MRPSELAREVLDPLVAILPARERVLALGRALDVEALAAAQAADVAEAERLGSRFAAVIWSEPVQADLPELRRIRALLEPGARLVVLNVVEPSALRRLRAFVTKERREPVSLEDLCSALALRGYLEPRVHPQRAGTRVVTAELPSAPDPLDDFFAQHP